MFYKGEIGENELINKLYFYTAQELLGGYQDGYEKTFFGPDWTVKDTELLNRVQNNIFAFSGAKSYAQAKEMRDSVYDGNGNIIPKNEYRRKALQINTKYNLQYLDAERQNVIASGTQGSRWVDIEENKDTHPMLEYVTARDSRVREEHRALDGIILSVDDPFWKSYYPPNGWRCRCSTRKLTEREAEHRKENYEGRNKMPVPDSDIAQRMAGKVVAKPFRHNAGTTEIFERDGHPYFKANKEAKEQQLSAVKNYGMKRVEDIYLRPDKLSKYKGEIKEKEDYAAFWDKMESKHGKAGEGFTLVDKTNRITAFFDRKLYAKMKEKGRSAYFDEILNVFNKPDEIWASNVSSPRMGVEFFNLYIRYYNDAPMVLLVDKKGIVNSFYRWEKKLEDFDKFRIGLLKKKR